MKNIIFIHAHPVPHLSSFCAVMRERGMPHSLIVIRGWKGIMQVIMLLLVRPLGHVVCLCIDIAGQAGRKKAGVRQLIRRKALRYVLFPRIDFFLYATEHTRQYYKSHGVTAKKLVSAPYHSLADRLHKIKKRPRRYADHIVYTSPVS